MTPAAARRRLLELHQRLLRRAVGLPPDTPGGDEGDQATASVQREVAGWDLDRVRGRVRAIEAAILRVDAGVYHLCERCGERIGERRQEALPETAVCRACAEAYERLAREDAR